MHGLRAVAALAASLAFAGPAAAHDAAAGSVRVGHVWMAPAPAGGTAAPVIPLLNTGREADRLTGIVSQGADRVELRRDGRPAAAVELAPGRPLAIRGATAAEALLVGLRRDARPGDRIPITLTFARASAVAIDIHVEAAPGH